MNQKADILLQLAKYLPLGKCSIHKGNKTTYLENHVSQAESVWFYVNKDVFDKICLSSLRL